MVLVKRRSILQADETRRGLPLNHMQESGRSRDRNSFSYPSSSLSSVTIPSSLFLKLFGTLISLSWICSFMTNYSAKQSLGQLKFDLEMQKAQYNESTNILNDAEASRQSVLLSKREVARRNIILQHEVRINTEMEEERTSNGKPKYNKNRKRGLQQHDILVEWLEERQEALHGKISNLQGYVQEASKKAVIQKYGYGPHRVNFTVDFVQTNTKGSFVVEMAPLNELPHSVYMFLEMVSKKVYDNTVFWHHDYVEHVLASALRSYETGDFRHFEVRDMGFSGLSFPEYSPNFQHDRYTLGFHKTGPEFYINTDNNTVLHGPGGQSRPNHEADPCFAKVVEGREVIDQMYQISLSTKPGRKYSWHDNDLTHILTVEIV